MSRTIELPHARAGATRPFLHADAIPRVALMGRSLRGSFSGVARYTDELARALERRLGPNLSVFVTRSDDRLHGLRLRRVRAPFATPNEYARALWEQTIVPFDVRRLRPDVYHSPNYIIPGALGCPSIVTVHDTAFLDRSVHRLTSHIYLTLLTSLAVRKASRIVCVSQYTASRVAQWSPRAANKLRVIGEGISERFSPQPSEAVRAFRRAFQLERPYILFVGTVEPRKNLVRLIDAFGLAVAREPLAHELVIAGAEGWKTGAFRDALARSPVRDRIRCIGYVPDRMLPAAYTGADAFVYPSIEEGYGLPPLEAMACGTPVVTSGTTALAEVAGPAAETVEPTDVAAIAGAIARVLTDEPRRRELREAGVARARTLRWDTVADEMIALYAEVAG